MLLGIVVGYSGFTLRPGNIMVSQAFLNVGDGTKTRLTDIKPTGYENLAYWKTGKGNGFNNKVTVAVLSKTGATADDPKFEGKQLKWAWMHAKGFANPGYWVRYGESTAIVPGSEEDYQFKPGEAVWAYCNGYSGTNFTAPDDQYSLQNSGQAMLDAGTFTLRPGNIGTGAPLSRAIRLTEIKPIGYENLAYWKTGKGNGFNNKVTIAVLSKTGATADDPKFEGKQLKWAWMHAKGFANPGYWVRYGESTAIVPGSEEDYQFKLGEAVWAYCNGYTGTNFTAPDDQYSLEFPAVEDDNRVTE